MFGVVVLFGAPYLPTMRTQQDEALDLLGLKPGQILLELGSGDGRLMRRAASMGIRCIGYELNPILVIVSRLVCWRYRKLVDIRLANFWTVELPKVDGVYVFLLDRYMNKLDKKIAQDLAPTKLVSFAFKVPNRRIDNQVGGLYLYKYKANKS